MNLREIKDLIGLMNEHKLTEIEIESEGTKIKLKKSNGEVVMEHVHHAAPAPASRQAEAEAAAEKAPAKNTQAIRSPMVGTFYSAPAPDAELYVKVGSKVEVGQVICIIEAMKLMNEIKSEVRGTVTEIHCANGDAVEFGQPMFSVAP